MNEPVQFGEYTVRMATKEDRGLLERWIAADEDHRGRVPPEFFFTEEPGVGCYVLLNFHNDPVFFFRTSHVERLDVQFGPSGTREERKWNRDALSEGLDWFAAICATRGATEIIFESRNPLLRSLAIKQMGCAASQHELVRSLEPERCKVVFPRKEGQ
jgi:hypothetical protein